MLISMTFIYDHLPSPVTVFLWSHGIPFLLNTPVVCLEAKKGKDYTYKCLDLPTGPGT